MKKALFILLLLTACEPMRAVSNSPVIDPKTGASSGEISFTFEGGQGPNDTVLARLSDGEFFRGNVVSQTTQSQGTEWVTNYIKDKKGKLIPQQEAQDTTNTSYSSSAHGVLIGDKGHSMNCDFTLNEPEFGLSAGGGIGSCQISDGRTIPVNIQVQQRFLKY